MRPFSNCSEQNEKKNLEKHDTRENEKIPCKISKQAYVSVYCMNRFRATNKQILAMRLDRKHSLICICLFALFYNMIYMLKGFLEKSSTAKYFVHSINLF